MKLFNDTLDVDGTSGTYTLQGSVNGEWHDIYTISGPASGTIVLDDSNNVEVDTNLFVPGQTYNFRWIDSEGTVSNVKSLLIPIDAFLHLELVYDSQYDFLNPSGSHEIGCTEPIRFQILDNKGSWTTLNTVVEIDGGDVKGVYAIDDLGLYRNTPVTLRLIDSNGVVSNSVTLTIPNAVPQQTLRYSVNGDPSNGGEAATGFIVNGMVNVNWGDGNSDNGVSSGNHSYSTPGDYTIILSGNTETLTSFQTVGHNVTELIELPDTLETVNCQWGLILSLPPLPPQLKHLYVTRHPLASLPVLPDGLLNLDCFDNQLTALPSLPPSLLTLACGGNALTLLPPLPNGMTYLGCQNNQLTELPVLPTTLTTLYAQNNQLTDMPTLPTGLQHLYAQNNLLVEVNTLLSQLVANGLHNGHAILDGQTPPSPPSGQGNTDAATLSGNGSQVVTD